MQIKICGLKHRDNIEAITALKPNFVGFICYAPSPRFAAELNDDILAVVPETISKTAVFVNETAETIHQLIDKYHFDAIQLHGNESPEFCAGFKGKVTVLKAFGMDENFDFERLNQYVGSIDFFLFDTKTDKHGGSGRSFDWSLLNEYRLNVPFFLSGGLSLDNLEEVKSISHPQFYGVDLNSRFETEPGLKDINKLKNAFELLR
jgi:phosphoribosylanthranilate isomerase